MGKILKQIHEDKNVNLKDGSFLYELDDGSRIIVPDNKFIGPVYLSFIADGVEYFSWENDGLDD
jgi:hypothetical protein